MGSKLDGRRLFFVTGLPVGGADILQPQNIHGAIKVVAGNARSLAVVLNSPAVAVKLSAYTADCIIALIQKFTEASQLATVKKYGSPPADVTGKESLKVNAEREWDQEDLRCGLFEKTELAASRPGQHCLLPSYFQSAASLVKHVI